MRDAPFEDLAPGESMLRGRWLSTAAGPVPDAVEQRIRWLVAHRLDPLGSATDGWDWLFRDRVDGRLWELTFPEGMLLHSGPRLLRVIDAATSSAKYPRPPRDGTR